MDEIYLAPALFGATGTLYIVLGAPLAAGKVSRNSWYGYRTSKTLSDEDLWYTVNAVAGRDMAAGGVLIVATSLLMALAGDNVSADSSVLLLLALLIGVTLWMAVRGYYVQNRASAPGVRKT